MIKAKTLVAKISKVAAQIQNFLTKINKITINFRALNKSGVILSFLS